MSTRPNTSTLRTQRKIQRSQDQRDAQGGSKAKAKAKRSKDMPAVQAGSRRQPARLPAQHLEKPRLESELAMAPRFQAPDYRGSGKLEHFAALITGADSGIGRAVAVLFAREGADVAVAYHSSTEDARETQRCVEAEGRRSLLLQGDVKNSTWCDDAVKAPIGTALQLLKISAGDQAESARLFEVVERQLRQLVKLIDGLLDGSRIAIGMVVLQRNGWTCGPSSSTRSRAASRLLTPRRTCCGWSGPNASSPSSATRHGCRKRWEQRREVHAQGRLHPRRRRPDRSRSRDDRQRQRVGIPQAMLDNVFGCSPRSTALSIGPRAVWASAVPRPQPDRPARRQRQRAQ